MSFLGLAYERGAFMGQEQRRFQRVILKKEVLINGSIRAQGLDLSIGGMYVHTGRSFPIGDEITVTLPLVDKFISIKARVQNFQPSLGMGIMFMGLSSAQKEELGSFVDSLLKIRTEIDRKIIMLVEDQEASRRMNKSKLTLDGFSVIEAKDGIEALDLLAKERIDLMVLDLYMEPMDGYKVLSIVRQNPQWQNIPVLVLSARSSSEEVDKAITAGATEFLVKMMTSPVKLSQRIKAYLGSI
jgi:two-component system chemotaxis response regulator CheY